MFIQRSLTFILTALALAVLAGCAGTSASRESAKHPQWKSLVAGNTLDGWTQKGGKAK